MAEPFLGEIRMFSGNFEPSGWAFCHGQLLAISSHSALFSLFGTIYGGDGRTTFGLPDLRGRIPLHQGQGPGLSTRTIGSRGGIEAVTLTEANLPGHNHGNLQATTSISVSTSPFGRIPGQTAALTPFAASGPDQVLNSDAVASVGGGVEHTNLMPTLSINFIVALVGIFPSRS